jgi:hypothetical protein
MTHTAYTYVDGPTANVTYDALREIRMRREP